MPLNVQYLNLLRQVLCPLITCAIDGCKVLWQLLQQLLMLAHALLLLQGLSTFWIKVQDPIKLEAITAEEFFRADKWLGRAREYRLLAEQLDIVNWYYTNKHLDYKSGDYCAGLESELAEYTAGEKGVKDNKKRPGRYRLIQEQELLHPEFLRKRVDDSRLPESSLLVARLLKKHLTRPDQSRISFQDPSWFWNFDNAAEVEQGEHQSACSCC
jgi:hypothetical protein